MKVPRFVFRILMPDVVLGGITVAMWVGMLVWVYLEVWHVGCTY